MLGLGRHASLPLPAAVLCLPGLITELGKHSRWPAGPAPLLSCFPHLPPDDLSWPLIPCQPAYTIDTAASTPAVQPVTTTPGITAQNDLHCRPCRSHLPHDPCDVCPAPCRSMS